MSSHDYIPRADASLDAWLAAFFPAADAWWKQSGLDLGPLETLNQALETWQQAFPAHVAARAAAEAARAEKDQARTQLEAAIRPVVRVVQAFPTTTDAQRAGMGIAVRDARTRTGTAPASKPLIVVEDAGRRTHALRLIDETTPTRKARPRGVERAEVFVAFTPTNDPAPADPAAYRYVQSVSDGKAVLSFDAPQGGMQAHYVARWVTRRGAIGPWSDTSSATVAA